MRIIEQLFNEVLTLITLCHVLKIYGTVMLILFTLFQIVSIPVLLKLWKDESWDRYKVFHFVLISIIPMIFTCFFWVVCIFENTIFFGLFGILISITKLVYLITHGKPKSFIQDILSLLRILRLPQEKIFSMRETNESINVYSKFLK